KIFVQQHVCNKHDAACSYGKALKACSTGSYRIETSNPEHTANGIKSRKYRDKRIRVSDYRVYFPNLQIYDKSRTDPERNCICQGVKLFPKISSFKSPGNVSIRSICNCCNKK